MTDNEIIKALVCCMEGTGRTNCENCPLTNEYCRKELPRLALDLINRQQAEIERLEYCNEVNISSIGTLHERIKEKDAEIEKWTKELKITREYMHNNGLEWDLLSYYTRKEEQNA